MLLLSIPHFALSQVENNPTRSFKDPIMISGKYCWDTAGVIYIANELTRQENTINDLALKYDFVYREWNKEKIHNVLLSDAILDERKSTYDEKKEKEEVQKMYVKEVKKRPMLIGMGTGAGILIGFGLSFLK